MTPKSRRFAAVFVNFRGELVPHKYNEKYSEKTVTTAIWCGIRACVIDVRVGCWLGVQEVETSDFEQNSHFLAYEGCHWAFV